MEGCHPNESCSWPFLVIQIPSGRLHIHTTATTDSGGGGTWRLHVALSPVAKCGRLSTMLLASLKRAGGRGRSGASAGAWGHSSTTHWMDRPIERTSGCQRRLRISKGAVDEKANSAMSSFAMP